MLNRIVLMGRLVANPELRHTANGTAVAGFTLAVGRDYARLGEEKITDFIDIVAWRERAEFASKYFTKGQLVAVDGSLQTRTYQDKSGMNRKAFEVIADKLHFAESKRNQAASSFMDTMDEVGNNSSGSVIAEESASENNDASKGSSFKNGELDYTELPVSDDDLPF